jgi:membrane associated rhomboid family serine protease
VSSSRAWPAVCAALALASAAFWLAARAGWLLPQHWFWQADGWARAPWTLWTAALAHLQAAPWLGNLLALCAVAALGAALGAGRRDAAALLVAWPLATLALRLWPAVASYGGLAGPVHAAVAVLAVRARRSPRTQELGWLLLLGLIFKLALERGWAYPVGFNTNWGCNVVYAAHLTGAAVGLLAALALDGRGPQTRT